MYQEYFTNSKKKSITSIQSPHQIFGADYSQLSVALLTLVQSEMKLTEHHHLRDVFDAQWNTEGVLMNNNSTLHSPVQSEAGNSKERIAQARNINSCPLTCTAKLIIFLNVANRNFY